VDLTNASGETLTLNESNRTDIAYEDQSSVGVRQNGTAFANEYAQSFEHDAPLFS